MRVCPSGWLCQWVRAQHSKVTIAPIWRPGSSHLNGESIRTRPVNQVSGPAADGCDPARVTFMAWLLVVTWVRLTWTAAQRLGASSP